MAIPVPKLPFKPVARTIIPAVTFSGSTGSAFQSQTGQTSSSTLNQTARPLSKQQVQIAALNQVLPLLYGRVRRGPLIAGMLVSQFGYNNDGSLNTYIFNLDTYSMNPVQLITILLWGYGECEEIESISVNDGSPEPGQFHFSHYTGTLTQGIDPILAAAYALIGKPFTSNLPGICYTVATMSHLSDDDHFPRYAAIIKGKKVRTSEFGDPVYSNVPAYCIADFITSSVYGMNRAVDWSSVADLAAANNEIIDDEVSRTLNIALDKAQPGETWLQVLRDYAGCWAVPEGDAYRLIPDIAGSSVITFDTSNIVQGSLKLKLRGTRDVPTVVSVDYTDTSILPWAVISESVEQDGVLLGTVAQRLSKISKPGIQRKLEAHRYAVQRINEGILNDLSIDFKVFDEGLAVQVGDICTVDHPWLLTATLFRMTKIDPVEPGRWEISAVRYDSRKYLGKIIQPPIEGGCFLIREIGGYILREDNVSKFSIPCATPVVPTVAWNPADKSVNLVLSNSNRTATSSAGASGVRSTVAHSSGKYYWEVTLDAGPSSSSPFVGIKTLAGSLTANGPFGGGADYGVFSRSPNTGHQTYIPGANVNAVGPALAVADVYMFALDLSTGKFWVGRNGSWDVGGNPGAGTGAYATGISGTYYLWTVVDTATIITGRFTRAAMSYTVPTGFSAWDGT